METDKIPQETPMTQVPLENEPIHKSFLNQKGNFLLILGAVVIILVLLGAGGYLLTMNKNSNSNQQPPQPIPTSTQPILSNETANWKTYTNSYDDFSFKYPADFKTYGEVVDDPKQDVQGNSHVKYSPDSTIKYENGGFKQKTGIEIGSTLYGPGEDIENYKPNADMDNSIVSNMKLSAGSKAEAYISKGEQSITVVIYYKQYNKDMRVMLWCGGDNTRCKNLLMQILPTFKFSDTSNWNVYKDEQGKFSFSYPSEFKVIPDFFPSSQYKNSWKIVKNQQTDQDYVVGKSIDVIILENHDFEIRKSDKLQNVVYSKELEINGFKAMQQILVGTDIHASDSTVVITQIKDSSGKNLISFTTGLYNFIQDRTAYYGALNEENYLNIIQRDLSTYNKIISTFKFSPQ